jgi:hypothetical protein
MNEKNPGQGPGQVGGTAAHRDPPLREYITDFSFAAVLTHFIVGVVRPQSGAD